jgi:hypothetical protein
LKNIKNKIALFFLIILFLIISLLIWINETSKNSVEKPEFIMKKLNSFCGTRTIVRLYISFILTIIIIGYIFLSHFFKKKIIETILLILLIVFFIISTFMYFYMERGLCKYYHIKFWDSFHYYLGPKYFDELGYTKLYECTILADRETNNLFNENDQIRNLDNYEFEIVSNIDNKCKSAFSDKRWEEFKSDIFFFEKNSGSLFKDIIKDHGYNGPPFKTFLSRLISNSFKLNFKNLTLLTILDIFVIFFMLFFVIKNFSWKIGLLFGIFYFINFADRFYYTGGSFIRFFWISFLGLSISFMKKKNYKLSGIFLALSSMLTIFPILFFSGILLKAIYDFLTTKKIKKKYQDFHKYFLLSIFTFFLLSISFAQGIENWEGFLKDMTIHSDKLTSSRIGFKYLFLFRGEITEKDSYYSYNLKQEEFNQIKIKYYLIVFLIILFTVYLCLKLDDVTATILLGFILFFTLFGSVEYYFACLAFLVLLWHKKIKKTVGLISIAILFLMMSLIYLAFEKTHYLKFVHNTAMSLLITIYLFYVLIYISFNNKIINNLISKIKLTKIPFLQKKP